MTSVECGFEGAPDWLEYRGPTIYVQIGFDHNFDSNKESVPNLPATPLPALVDTGAYRSCIDSGLAERLGLPVINRRTVGGVHGAQPANLYPAHIYIPDLDYSMSGVFIGAHLPAGGQPHFALLGRDFLKDFTMTYDGQTGTVRITKA